MVPEFYYFMLPFLKYLSDGKTHSLDECVNGVSEILNLTEEDKSELVKSGTKPKYNDRTQWSKTYLQWAGLVKTVKRGHYAITEKGLKLLQKDINVITRDFLAENYPEFVANSTKEKKLKASKTQDAKNEITLEIPSPLAVRRNCENAINGSLFEGKSPATIKSIIAKSLRALGYYMDPEELYVDKDNISGCAYLDRLHIVPIFVYISLPTSNVSRNDIGKILPMMYEKSCSNALFITMGTFSPEAKRFTAPSTNIVKVDIREFSQILLENNVGVKNVTTTVVDEDFYR